MFSFMTLAGGVAASGPQFEAKDENQQDTPQYIAIKEEQNIPGRDLRSRRAYNAGLINEKEKLYVLYLKFDNGRMRFYNNEENMRPILTVDLSSSPQVNVGSIVFEDVNGDGYNDLKIPSPGGKWSVWHWIPENECFSDPIKD